MALDTSGIQSGSLYEAAINNRKQEERCQTPNDMLLLPNERHFRSDSFLDTGDGPIPNVFPGESRKVMMNFLKRTLLFRKIPF